MVTKSDTYNQDLALYNSRSSKYEKAECLPDSIQVGYEYSFLKKGHRTYQPGGEVILLEMRPDNILFDFKARVAITHLQYEIHGDQSYTAGKYLVKELIS